jgi:hypothetical protein
MGQVGSISLLAELSSEFEAFARDGERNGAAGRKSRGSMGKPEEVASAKRRIPSSLRSFEECLLKRMEECLIPMRGPGGHDYEMHLQ